MTTTNVIDREAEIEELFNKYQENLKTAVTMLAKNKEKDSFDYRKVFNDAHGSGTTFFNKFDTSLDDYLSMDINPDQAVRKPEDVLNIIPTIFKHWRIIRNYCKKYELPIPEPSPTVYGSIQRVVKKFYPQRVTEFRNQFIEMNLPTVGFDTDSPHSGWKKRPVLPLFEIIIALFTLFVIGILVFGSLNPTSEIIIGLIILVASGMIVFRYMNPTGVQYLFIKLVMAIGASLTLMGVGHGFINIKWNLTKDLLVMAGGTVATFLVLYFLNPKSPPDMSNNNPNR
jgi:hypothetical protein